MSFFKILKSWISWSCRSLARNVLNSGAVRTSRKKALGRPYWILHMSISSRSSFCTSLILFFRLRSKIWLNEFGNSATVLAFEKPPALWVKHLIISFPFFPLLAKDLISFRTEYVVALKVNLFSYFRVCMKMKYLFHLPQNNVAHKTNWKESHFRFSIMKWQFYENLDKIYVYMCIFLRLGCHHIHLYLLHDFHFQYQNKNFWSQILLGSQLSRFFSPVNKGTGIYPKICNIMFNVNWNGSTYFFWGRIRNYDIYSIFSIDRYWRFWWSNIGSVT